MSSVLNDKVTQQLIHTLDRTRRDSADSLEKLSTGQVFTAADPRPADRALAEGLEHKLRGISSSKRNINDAVSLLQTAESGFSEISNMLVRMKEINSAAAASTMTSLERKYLLIEYKALFDEVDRIAATTEFNSIPLLDGGNEKVPERLILRVGDPFRTDDGPNDDGDWNTILFNDLKKVVATTAGLGLKPVRDLLADADEDGIDQDAARELMESEDSRFGSVYDEALDKVSNFRAIYGAMQVRLNKAMDYNDVAAENIAAAKSKIADVDYAQEVARMAQTNILTKTASALLAQNNLAVGLGLGLINGLLG